MGRAESRSGAGARVRAAGEPEHYLSRVGNGRLLTAQEEKDLARRYRDGDREARDELVERNVRLVISVAAKYRGRGLPFDDLVQEGTLGLMRAIDKFDPDRGLKRLV
ncbi:MAG: sigma-70 family RNA polymerase sigma factor [Acidobacteria bacterium]|nr:sigma-70 family RNA polymerase sigma factor [Acidobacteriota bacterium]